MRVITFRTSHNCAVTQSERIYEATVRIFIFVKMLKNKMHVTKLKLTFEILTFGK